MSDYPHRVTLYEVGPREGFQIEKDFIPTERKLKLINALGQTGVANIEATSFVHPKWVQQMADAEQVSEGLESNPKVDYSCLYLNASGLQRAAATGRYLLEGMLRLSASPAFNVRNTNRTIDETVATFPDWFATYEQLGIRVEQANVNAAFGCNFQGDVPVSWVIDRIRTMESAMVENGHLLKRIMLADTMGWANPVALKRLVGEVRAHWPGVQIRLHLHDTRGTGGANLVAALELGVEHFDTAVGGLGGCPFAGNSGAAGNVCSEDVVFLCEEMGIETGIDLERLIDCALLAEEVVSHPLPGKVMRGGLLKRAGASV